MKQIPLGSGLFALVDDADFEWLSQFAWRFQKSTYGGKTYFYASTPKKSGSRGWMQMQRMLMGKKAGFIVDHKNRNTLDNQRHNLRWATPAQNNFNSEVRQSSQTGFKGVLKYRGKYVASIRINKKLKRLGTFTCPVEAAKAYNKAATEAEPEFAWLNPIPQEN